MAETSVESTNQGSGTPGQALDWNKLADSLGAKSEEEAQRRAYEIAEFVAKVENDRDSELVLKRGGKNITLALNKE
jgi:hypothetical protein